MVDEFLLKILACPACDDRPPVKEEDGGLVCTKCGRYYPITDGFPDMVVDSAIMPGDPRPVASTKDAT